MRVEAVEDRGQVVGWKADILRIHLRGKLRPAVVDHESVVRRDVSDQGIHIVVAVEVEQVDRRDRIITTSGIGRIVSRFQDRVGLFGRPTDTARTMKTSHLVGAAYLQGEISPAGGSPFVHQRIAGAIVVHGQVTVINESAIRNRIVSDDIHVAVAIHIRKGRDGNRAGEDVCREAGKSLPHERIDEGELQTGALRVVVAPGGDAGRKKGREHEQVFLSIAVIIVEQRPLVDRRESLHHFRRVLPGGNCIRRACIQEATHPVVEAVEHEEVFASVTVHIHGRGQRIIDPA